VAEQTERERTLRDGSGWAQGRVTRRESEMRKRERRIMSSTDSELDLDPGQRERMIAWKGERRRRKSETEEITFDFELSGSVTLSLSSAAARCEIVFPSSVPAVSIRSRHASHAHPELGTRREMVPVNAIARSCETFVRSIVPNVLARISIT